MIEYPVKFKCSKTVVTMSGKCFLSFIFVHSLHTFLLSLSDIVFLTSLAISFKGANVKFSFCRFRMSPFSSLPLSIIQPFFSLFIALTMSRHFAFVVIHPE